MKKYFVTVNGNKYEVEVEEVQGETKSQLINNETAVIKEAPKAPKVEKEPVKAQNKSTISTEGEKIESPMPGTILKVNVSEGATFKKGDVLFILEAMKMENEIMAPRDGSVAQVVVAKGVSVNTGDVLAVIK
ncbi:biotin/lipoyl-containing protein [Clostridium amazonitimonense]|uniref:biotin/lipoyl-containing protein n=1 Tax=Clostridium amazonitimonense TaxID=1499689 RepID=UPI00050992C0|nr:biotin/lipoyl-containing protein [Clostridium amazonitimonense]